MRIKQMLEALQKNKIVTLTNQEKRAGIWFNKIRKQKSRYANMRWYLSDPIDRLLDKLLELRSINKARDQRHVFNVRYV